MKTADLKLDTIYAVRHGNRVSPGIVLFCETWERIGGIGGSKVVYQKQLQRKSYGSQGLPVLTVLHGADWSAAIPHLVEGVGAARRALLGGPEAPELRPPVHTGLLLVKPQQIVGLWEDHLVEQERERQTQVAARAARERYAAAEQAAHDRVAAHMAWPEMVFPRTWIQLEAFAQRYASRQSLAVFDPEHAK